MKKNTKSSGAFDFVYGNYASTKDVLYFKARGTRPNRDLAAIIGNVPHLLKNAQRFYTDANYDVFSINDLRRFLTMDGTDKKTFTAEKYDIDNFAFLLYAMAEVAMPGGCFGVVYASTPEGARAVNCFVDENNHFHLVNPQTDKIFQPPADWQIYFVLI